MPRAKKKPTRATLWAYDVGFGDCLLLELGYGTRETRFVLFDFGTKKASPTKAARAEGAMGKIANDIKAKIAASPNGKLVAIVATHRHQDHISGFGGSSGATIAALKPDVVVQPWTDEPGKPATWRGPGRGKRGLAAAAAAADPLGFTPGAIRQVQQFAALALDEAATARARFGSTALSAIQSVATNNLHNDAALGLLARVCKKARHDYVFAGARAKNLERVLPGVRIQVLGPPSVNQYADILKPYAKKADDEYWTLRASLGDEHAFWSRARALQDFGVRARSRRGSGPFRGARAARTIPPEARWLVERMDRDRGESSLELVTAADRVLNNTSVILLLDIGKKRLLFPGDAQLEAWQYALEHAPNAAATKRALRATDLYKVGHHGSLNATPRKSLWDSFDKAGPAKKRGRLITVLSTLPGYFGGKRGAETEVPRKTLVMELRAKSECYATDVKRRGKALCVKVEVALG